jgi:hypothetical protein
MSKKQVLIVMDTFPYAATIDLEKASLDAPSLSFCRLKNTAEVGKQKQA